MKILALHQNDECSFCRKQKPKVYKVELETGRKLQLCWKDLEKMVDMLFEEKETSDAPRKASS